jgi:hypothetical protein
MHPHTLHARIATGGPFRYAILAASILIVSACAPCLRGIEHVTRQTNYGHEFCRATIEPAAESGVGGDAYPHCYYQRRDLGACRIMSVSPSGRLALWQDRSTGGLRILSTEWREPRWLSQKFEGQVQHVDWNEADSQVHVRVPGKGVVGTFYSYTFPYR